MKYQPQIRPPEMSMKELWLNAFVNLLARLPPEGAIEEADRALELCNAHWASPEWVESWQYKHSYPVGSAFEKGTADDPSSQANDSVGG